MRAWVASVFFVAALWTGPAQAQSSGGIDLQALPLPLSPTPASGLESARLTDSGSLLWSLRTSGLAHPISLRVPTPAPEGATASSVAGVVLTEFVTLVGLGHGFDAALGFGAHLYQSGPATSADGDSSFTGLSPRDPRLGFGWATQVKSVCVRPFAQIYIPVGDPETFAGESATRGKLGTALLVDAKVFHWHSEAAFIYREPVQISATTWGPQLLLATGATMQLGEGFGVGAEVFVLPVLSRQKSLSGQPGGVLIPAESLASLRYTSGNFSWGLAAGFGLPLSRTSSVHVERKFVRGPTTPTYRGFADVTFSL